MSQHKKIISLAIVLASVLLAINFGFRSSLGLFLKPVSETFGYGREVFAFSLALQNLLWGLSQPIAGAFADKFGTSRVIIVGSIFYSLGLYITATADSFIGLHLGAGILIGMGISDQLGFDQSILILMVSAILIGGFVGALFGAKYAKKTVVRKILAVVLIIAVMKRVVQFLLFWFTL